MTGTVANLNAALSGMVYTPTRNFSGSDSLAIKVSDPNGYALTNVALRVNVIAPTLTAPATGTVPLNGTLTFYKRAIQIADVNASTDIEQVVLTATHGNLRLGSTTGITFVSGANNSRVDDDQRDVDQSQRMAERPEIHADNQLPSARERSASNTPTPRTAFRSRRTSQSQLGQPTPASDRPSKRRRINRPASPRLRSRLRAQSRRNSHPTGFVRHPAGRRLSALGQVYGSHGTAEPLVRSRANNAPNLQTVEHGRAEDSKARLKGRKPSPQSSPRGRGQQGCASKAGRKERLASTLRRKAVRNPAASRLRRGRVPGTARSWTTRPGISLVV